MNDAYRQETLNSTTKILAIVGSHSCTAPVLAARRFGADDRANSTGKSSRNPKNSFFFATIAKTVLDAKTNRENLQIALQNAHRHTKVEFLGTMSDLRRRFFRSHR